MTTNPPIKRVFVIINPASGQPQPVLHTLNRVFAEAEVEWPVAITKGDGDGARAAAQAVEAEVDAVAVYGGDGSVMEVANALHGTSIPMAILPGGTANVLSIELAVPGQLEAAARLITDPTARIQPVDMGSLGDRLFFHLSAGVLGGLSNRADREAKDQNGFLAYLLSGLKELQQLPAPSLFRLTLDGVNEEVEGIGCMVTNFGRIGIADLRLSDQIDLSDGIMDVLVIRNLDVGTLVKMVGGAIASGEVSEAMWHGQARQVSFPVPPGMEIMMDGEAIETPPETLTAQIVPGAVSFIVPGGD